MKISQFAKRISTNLFAVLAMLCVSVPALAQLSGAYTINPRIAPSKTNYQNFTSAVGDMLSGTRTDGGTAYGPGISKAVTFNVADTTYNEQLDITPVSGASATNTITFASASGDSVSVVLYYAGTVVTFDTGSYVSFDKMTIQNTNYGSAVYFFDAASHDSLSHCIIRGTNGGQLVYVYGWGTGNSNISIYDCAIHGGTYGIYSEGYYTTPYQTKLSIIGNTIDSFYQYGIFSLYDDTLTISKNLITNPNAGGNNFYGIYVEEPQSGGFNVNKNKILLPGGSTSTCGIYFQYGFYMSSSNPGMIDNNFISIDSGSSTVYGYYAGEEPYYVDFVFNNVNITNTNSSSTGIYNYALYSNNPSTYLIYEDNISVNSGGGYAVGVSNTTYSGAFNYNDYFATGSYLGNWGGANESNLSAWQKASSQDANSVSGNPGYVSATDLHPTSSIIYHDGTSITGITDDIDGITRNASTPDIGAAEITPKLNDAGVQSIDSPGVGFCTGKLPVSVTVSNYGIDNISSVTIKWNVNSTAQTSYNWTGSLHAGQSIHVQLGTLTFAANTPYNIVAYTYLPNGIADNNHNNDTSTANVENGMGGTYTIGGTSPDYATFSDAVADLTTKGLCSNVIFNVRSGIYNESVTFPQILNASPTKTVIFQSTAGSSDSVLLTNSNNTYPSATVFFSGGSYITFRNIAIENTGNYYTAYFQNGSSNDSLSNCIIRQAGANDNVYIYGNNNPNSYISISNCGIHGGNYAVFSLENNNILITGSTIDSFNDYGIYTEEDNTVTISKNLVTNPSGSNYIYGIYLYEPETGLCKVFKNKIIFPVSANNYTYGIDFYYGFDLVSTNPAKIDNNYIYIGPGNGTAYGFYSYYPYYTNFVFNNINITTASASSAGSYINYPYTFTYENNIMVDSGGGYAIEIPSSSTPSTFNYNDYYVTPGSYLGNYVGTNESNLSAWQSSSSQDANSVSTNPGYASDTDLTPSNGVLYHAGTPVSGITTDIYGTLRNAATPDIGAVEFVPVALDASVTAIDGGIINFCAGNNNVSVTVANAGLNTLTTLTINWQVNGTNQTAYNWTGSLSSGKSATVNVGTYTFNGSNTYVIKAWTSKPNGGTNMNPNDDTDLTPTLNPGMSGSYDIGGGANNYSTFGGAVSDLIANGVCGPVTFNVYAGTYPEQVDIPSIQGASPVNTITFRSQSKDSTSVILAYPSTGYSPNNYVLALSGANYVTFKQITINCTGSSYYGAVVQLSGNASNNTFLNNIIRGVTTTNTGYYEALVYSMNSQDTGNVFSNNYMADGSVGFYFQGPSSTNQDHGNVFTGNTLDSVYYMAFYLYYETNLKVVSNTILNLGYTNSSYGIYAYNCVNPWISKNLVDSSTPNTGIYIDYCSGNVNVNKNKVYLQNGGNGIVSYDNQGTANSPSIFANNFVSVGGSASNYGIEDEYSDAGTYVFNNILMTNTSTTSAGFYSYNYSGSPVIIEDNISDDSGGGYAVYIAQTYYLTQYGKMNYNDWYVPSSSSYLGYWNGNVAGLSTWQSTTGMDANSISVSPGYTSVSDLHESATPLLDAGIGIASISDDIDGHYRPQNKPDIGAVEFLYYKNDAGCINILPHVPFAPGARTIWATIENFATTTLTKVTLQWTINGTSQTAYNWTGSLPSGDTTTVKIGSITFATGNSYSLKAWTYQPNGGTDDDDNNDTFSESACAALAGGTYTINPSGSGSSNFTSFNAAVSAMLCGGISGPVVFNVAAATYNEQVDIPAILGSSSTNTITFDGGAGNASTRILTYASTVNTSPYVMRFNGCSYVNVKNIDIQASSSGNYGWGLHFYNGCSNIIVNHCRIEVTGGSTSGNFAPVVLQSGSTSQMTWCCGTQTMNNLQVDSSFIGGGYYGIVDFAAPNGGVYNLNHWFLGDTIYNAYYYGLYSEYYQTGFKFNGNIINMNNANSNSIGIYAYEFYDPTATKGVQLNGNRIYNAGEYGIYFYYCFGGSSNPTQVYNNFIGGGFANANATGIYAYYAEYVNFWNNSVNMDYTGASSSAAAMYVSQYSYASIENNILAVTGVGSSALPFSGVSVLGTPVINYNDYYNVNGGTIFSYNGANYSASNYIGGGGFNSGAASANPEYKGVTDLRISDVCLRGASLGLTTDIFGATRSNPPSMGAYEATGGVSNDIGVDAIEAPVEPFAAGSQSITVRVRNYGINTVTSGNISYSVNGSTPVTISFTGSLKQCDTMQVTFSGSNQFSFASGNIYRVKSWTSKPNGGSDNNNSNDTTISSPLCVQMSGVYTINPLGSGGSNFTSFTAAVNELECAGINSPVTFNVADGFYNEQVYISTILGASASNTVVFQSASHDSSKVTIESNGTSGNNYVVELAGASYVKFSEISMEATNGNYGIVLGIENGSNSDSILNCQLIGVSTTSAGNSSLAVVYSPTALNNGDVFMNDLIENGSYGLFIEGQNNGTTGLENGTVINNNIFQNQYYMAMELIYLNAAKINSNIITTNSTYSNYYGMLLEYVNNATQVLKNKITGALGGYGIYEVFSNYGSASNPVCVIANNFISIGSGSYTTYGIYNEYGMDMHYYYNSINILSSSANSYAMYNYVPYNSPNVNVEDNVFANTAASTNGYAYYLYSGATYVTTENYNDYYVANGPNLLSLSNTNYTLSAWNSATGLDANSVSADPQFYSATDLHSVSPGIAQKGTPVTGVTDDIDGNPRSATKPCIGAAEFKVYANQGGIVAIDSPVAGFCPGSTYGVNVVLENFGSSTLTSANILFYINGIFKLRYEWTGSLATGSKTNVSIGSALIPAGTLVCVAKSDSANGVPDSNKNDSFISPLSPALSGVYKIGGAGAGYPTFPSAVSALNAQGVCGPVVFNVANGTYNEQIQLNVIPGSSATNTVIFQSASGDSSKVILTEPSSGSPATGFTVYLNGASNVTFKQISIENTGTNYYSSAVELNNGATNNQVINCQLIGEQTTNQTNYEAVVYAQAGGGYRDTRNIIQNNLIENGSYGVYFYGSSSPSPSSVSCDSGNIVTGNTITGAYYSEIYAYYQEAFYANGNNISGLTYKGGGYGIYSVDNDNLSIMDNKLYLTNGPNVGIFVDNCPNTGANVVANNMVSVGGNSQSYGIDDDYNYNTYYYFNSILITGTNLNSAAFYSVNYYNTPLTIENNIGVNTGGGYAVYMNYGYYIKTRGAMDYNDWLSTGSYLGYWQGTQCSNLAKWQSVSGIDADAISVNPLFASNSSLYAANANLAVGTPVSTPINITTDIDGKLRSTTTPDIGANEFVVPALDGGVLSINIAHYCGGSQNLNITLANYGSTTLSSDSIGWSVNGVAQTPYLWTGSLGGGDTANINVGTYNFSSGVYTIKTWSYSPNGGTNGTHAYDTAWDNNVPQGLSGTYTIGGTSPNYTTFTKAVADLVAHGVCGPVTFNVANGGYYEQVSIPAINGASATNTITFQSLNGDSALVNLNYSNASNTNNYVLQLNGANYFTFKEITIKSGNSQYGTVIDIRGGANNNQFLNNRLLGAKPNYYFYPSYAVYSGTDVDNYNVFKENEIADCDNGFYLSSNSGSNFDIGIVIQDNIIDSMGYSGIYAYYQDSMYIYRNIIRNIYINANYSYGWAEGINMEYSKSCTIGKNKISVLPGGYGGYGMYLYDNTSTAAAPNTVYDNFISQQGTNNSYTGFGVYIAYGAYTNFYYNNVFTNDSSTATSTPPSAAAYLAYCSYLNSENNIFVNKGYGYDIDMPSLSYNDTSDYNDYFTNGTYMGLVSGLQIRNLINWQGATSLDYYSISVDPGYTSNTDLHVKNSALKDKATVIPGITDDIDGRPRGTNPDIGATQVTPALNNDLAILGLYQPQNGSCGTSTERVAVIVFNAGAHSETNIPVYASISGATSATLNDTIRTTLLAGGTDTFYFSATLDASAGGKYTFTGVSVNLSADQLTNNDTLAPLSIVLHAVPSSPSTVSNAICGAGSVKLAASPVSGVEHYWYTTASGVDPVASGDTFSTPVIGSTTTYYVTASVASNNTLTTFFSGANPYQGAMFNITASHNIRVDSFDANIQGSGTDYADVYYIAGTYVGNETNSSAWTLAGTVPVTFKGAGNHTRIGLAPGSGFMVPEGKTVGVYIRLHSNTNLRFTNGSNNISNFDFTISEGEAITGSFSSVVSSESWNGEVYYTVWGCASQAVAATATINYGPTGASYAKGSPFNGNFNSGTSSSPDGICAGQDATYNLNPPSGFSNSGYGTTWKVSSVKVATANGSATAHYTVNAATSSADAYIEFSPTAADEDSTYIVTTTVSNLSTGCDTTFSRYIYVSPLPNVSFSYSSGCSGVYTSFSNTSTYGSGTPTALWYFGDGDTSTALSPVHVYTSAGTYTVKLYLTNSSGCTDSSINSSVKIITGPAPKFGAVGSCLNTSEIFVDSSSASPSTIHSWLYEFGDGDTSSAENPKHKYASAGNYTVTLTISNAIGCTDSTTRNITINPSPVAAFGASNLCSSDTALFTDSSSISSGTISAYAWKFGDGNTSTAQSPKHKYATNGNYNVTFTVTSGTGCTDSITKSISIVDAPTAAFSTANGCFGDSTRFTDKSSATSATIIAWSWAFGDGNVSSLQNPSHLYASAGTYTVLEYAYTGAGCFDTISHSVTVNPAPTVKFTAPAVCDGNSTVFTDSSTVSSGSIASYLWKFGDGNTSSSASPTHLYANSGSFNATLVVTTNNGCTDSLTQKVTVNAGPVAKIGTVSGCNGSAVQFADSSSGTISSRTWRFGDGTGNTSTAKNPSYTYSDTGIYIVTLVVANGSSCIDSTTRAVHVYGLPVAKFGNSQVCQGNPTSFYDSSVAASGTTLSGWSWNFGDGATATNQSPNHTYKTSGTFTVKLVVTSNGGCTAIDSLSVTVNPTPVASYTATTTTVCSGDSIGFTNKTASTGSFNFAWNFDDGTSSNAISPYHTFYNTLSAPIKDTVWLKATNASGCADSFSKIITVNPVPTANFSVIGGCVNSPTVFIDSSTGGKSYSWNFGDTKTSTSKSPAHTYTSNGTYPVVLTVNGTYGCSASYTDTIITTPSPVAGFTVGATCNPIHFTDTSGNAVGAHYIWSFGDGDSSTVKDPSHSYVFAGSETVVEAVISTTGCADTFSEVVTPTAPPLAGFKASVKGRTVTVTAVDTPQSIYVWNFGDGSVDSGQTTKDTTHTYKTIGKFTVKYTVYSSGGCSADSTITIVTTGIDNQLASKLNLSVYPNPFKEGTNITYTLDASAEVQISVIDETGREIAVLSNGMQPVGEHQAIFDADKYNASAGLYLLRITVNNETVSKQIIRLK